MMMCVGEAAREHRRHCKAVLLSQSLSISCSGPCAAVPRTQAIRGEVRRGERERRLRPQSLKMLATMLTAMYLMVRVAEQFGLRWVRQERLPYMVSQPMPWQVHYVSQSRRTSRTEELDGLRRNSGSGFRKDSSSNTCQCPIGPSCKDKAATTIQTQYRKYQQKKQNQNHNQW
uniref:Uncharacterized protein n=1 Tax=Scleropages formosus TaxID=113540 RepID=A0A8C9RGA2_SCLFO